MKISMPEQWCQVEFENNNYLLGIDMDEQNLGCQIYLVDVFHHGIWLQMLQSDVIVDSLNAQGFLIIDDEKLLVFLQRLKESIHQENSFILKKNEKDLFTLKFHGKIEWEVSLEEPDHSDQFWSKFILTQFAAVNTLQYQLSKLTELIRTKDRYIQYLSENYKFINGDEMIKKYSVINPDSDAAMHEFNDNKWLHDIMTDYKDESDDLTKVKNAISNLPVRPKVSSSATKDEELAPKRVKREPKKEENKDSSKKTTNVSPRKRQGMFKSKKKP